MRCLFFFPHSPPLFFPRFRFSPHPPSATVTPPTRDCHRASLVKRCAHPACGYARVVAPPETLRRWIAQLKDAKNFTATASTLILAMRWKRRVLYFTLHYVILM